MLSIPMFRKRPKQGKRHRFAYALLATLALSLCLLVAGYWQLCQSLPRLTGESVLPGLNAPVSVSNAAHGMPKIVAANREDALRALGFVSARDRLFQMDLMRRKNAGQLAEIFGGRALDSDIRMRTLGFQRVAQAALSRLPARQRGYLEAYAQGVNAYIDSAAALPYEFTALRYRPAAWRGSDSLLVALGIVDQLGGRAEQEERMLSVMEQCLPPAAMAFLTPDSDPYTDALLGERHPSAPIPLAALQSGDGAKQHLAGLVQPDDTLPGSNAWAVNGKLTADGRAILANDMHLRLGVPSVWYRAELHYPGTDVAGVVLPGLPLVVAGSTAHLAWGGTNLTGDFLDLVGLQTDPQHPGQYFANGQWRPFNLIEERIPVRDAAPHPLQIRTSQWGPVSAKPLLGKPVAIRWTALDSDILNLDLSELEQAQTVQQGVAIANRSGGAQLNLLLADAEGHIAWTIMGRIPQRVGGDGSVSRVWADGMVGWDGYVASASLPNQIDPPGGLLVSANERHLHKAHPLLLGHQFANGYRAYRIKQSLQDLQQADEAALFALQLDTRSELYAFYHELALSLLSPQTLAQQPDMQELHDALLAWDGKADTGSVGFALLQNFRNRLTQTIFTPLLARCQKLDTDFRYAWSHSDVPLQALLREKPAQLLPDAGYYHNWDAFILAQLRSAAAALRTEHPGRKLDTLVWGDVNKARLAHPFSLVFPLLGRWLDMPQDALAGCSHCVRVATPDFGASERLVVSPSRLDAAILHMPAGQSAHPLSPYYRDQQSFWVQGLALPLLAEPSGETLLLKPANQ